RLLGLGALLKPRADALGRGLGGARLPRRAGAREQRLDLAQLVAQQRFRHGLSAHYLDLAPLALRIGVQRTSSSLNTSAAFSPPTPSTGSKPTRRSSCWNCASAIACCVASLIRATI